MGGKHVIADDFWTISNTQIQSAPQTTWLASSDARGIDANRDPKISWFMKQSPHNYGPDFHPQKDTQQKISRGPLLFMAQVDSKKLYLESPLGS